MYSILKQNKIATISILILIIGTVFYLNSDEEITITEPVWECEFKIDKWECKTTFELINNSGTYKRGKIALRGMALKPAKGPSVSLAEDKIIKFEINAKDTIKFQDVVFSKRKPKIINATIIELE